MLCLKKVYSDELLQLALILSLLKVNPDSYLEIDPYINVNSLDIGNGTSWRSYSPNVLRSHYVHPKSLDSVLLNYEREVFADLNSLGRYNRINAIHNRNITAYLLNVDRGNANANTTEQQPHPDISNNVQRTEGEASALDSTLTESAETPVMELTQEDMDLIEVLWKQDVDLGFSLEIPGGKSMKPTDNLDHKPSVAGSGNTANLPDDDIEKLKTLEALNNDALKTEDLSDVDDSWNGLSYDIDTETGEYILKGSLEDELPVSECDSPLPLGDLPLPEFLLEEALQLVGLDDDLPQESVSSKEAPDSASASTSSASSPSCAASAAASATLESLRGDASSPDAVASSSSVSSTSTSRGFPSKELDSDEELDLLTDMIQTAQFHHNHPRAFQSRMPFVRTMSMEQRWQDLANLLSLPGDTAGMPPHPFAHHHHHHHPALHNYSHPHGHGITYGPEATRGVLLHNATLNPPMGDINGTGPYTNIGGTNLGSAVATSMNLTNSSEPMGDTNVGPHYKIETPHDMLYYPNHSSEMNQTTEGFLSSILNDEDLQLMDMAMNEGMYTMRMLENNNGVSNLSMSNSSTGAIGRSDAERIDASSDSAVSSMGSERVPSLSDSEWCDAGSDSGHTPGDHYVVDYHGSKYRPYDYSYNSRQHATNLSASDASRIPPVAQKKHHMFGKRYFQEQGASAVIPHQPPNSVKYEYGDPTTPSFTSPLSQAEGAVGHKPPEIKYSCTMEFARHHQPTRPPIEHVQHNHTYHLPAESTGAMQRPVSRDKAKRSKSEEEHLTRDEKRARALNVPLTVDDIINLPMDEFNERLSKYDLSEPQLSLIRDIRRRGKNKVAAQNCRKRKLDQILSLADEVKEMRDRKHRLITERDFMLSERQRMKDKYAQLYRHVFQNLRDPDGNQYSPYQYNLQQSADGSILLVPGSNSTMTDQEHKEPHHNRKE